MIVPLVCSVCWIIAIAFLLGWTPERVTEDLMALLSPKDSLGKQAHQIRDGKQKKGLYHMLYRLQTALAATGKGRRFSRLCLISLILFAVGGAAALLLGNVFLLPVLSVAAALLPFFYTVNALTNYEKRTKEEMETALSIITTAYVRSGDIRSAVHENLGYIKPPLREAFLAFEGDCTSISSNTKRAILNLKDRIDNVIFREWCDALLRCQDDRTLMDTLQPIVAKLTDVRIVNTELQMMLASARNEYWMMVLLVVGNIPLLYLLNKEWFHTLLYSTAGKAVLGVCGLVILITALFMQKFTKPIEYKI